MQEVSEAAREARRGKQTWESAVETGVNNFMRNKGMITMTEEHSSHVEEAKAEVEDGEFWDSVTGVPLITSSCHASKGRRNEGIPEAWRAQQGTHKGMLGRDGKEAHWSQVG